MQSSFMKDLPARLKEAIQWRRPRSSGPSVARPLRRAAECSVAVDNAEVPDPQTLVSLTAAPRHEPERRTDAAAEEEPGRDRAARDDRQLRRELAAHVGRLA